MKRTAITIVLGMLVVFGACAIFAQSKPETAKVELKQDVSLDIRNMQYDLAKLVIQEKNIEQQFQQLQQQITAKNATLQDKLSTALERSGFARDKYVLNPDTLEVTVKTVTPTPAATPASPAKH